MGVLRFLKQLLGVGERKVSSSRKRKRKGISKKKGRRRATSTRVKKGVSSKRNSGRKKGVSPKKRIFSTSRRMVKRRVKAISAEGRRGKKKQPVLKKKHILKEKEVGVVTHYFGKISVCAVRLKATLKRGDKIHIKGAHDDFYQTVTSIQINRQDVSVARKGDEVGIKVIRKVHENDRVYVVFDT